jgi:hypothetical protein
VPVASPLALTAYPNPTTTAFNVMVEGGTNEKLTLMVYGIDGKIVYQASGNSNTKYSFGNSFNIGVYIVKVIQGSTLQTLKLIKEK